MEKKLEIVGRIERETEKAVLVDAAIDTHCGELDRKVWFPKSRIEIVNGKVRIAEGNLWLLDAKNRELAETTRAGFIGLVWNRVS